MQHVDTQIPKNIFFCLFIRMLAGSNRSELTGCIRSENDAHLTYTDKTLQIRISMDGYLLYSVNRFLFKCLIVSAWRGARGPFYLFPNTFGFLKGVQPSSCHGDPILRSSETAAVTQSSP